MKDRLKYHTGEWNISTKIEICRKLIHDSFPSMCVSFFRPDCLVLNSFSESIILAIISTSYGSLHAACFRSCHICILWRIEQSILAAKGAIISVYLNISHLLCSHYLPFDLSKSLFCWGSCCVLYRLYLIDDLMQGWVFNFVLASLRLLFLVFKLLCVCLGIFSDCRIRCEIIHDRVAVEDVRVAELATATEWAAGQPQAWFDSAPFSFILSLAHRCDEFYLFGQILLWNSFRFCYLLSSCGCSPIVVIDFVWVLWWTDLYVRGAASICAILRAWPALCPCTALRARPALHPSPGSRGFL